METLYGRRRSLPELKSSNFAQRSFGERVALNMPIQGTAADIIKLAMVNVAGRLRKEGLAAKLILQVHDELIVECPEAEAETVKNSSKRRWKTWCICPCRSPRRQSPASPGRRHIELEAQVYSNFY